MDISSMNSIGARRIDFSSESPKTAQFFSVDQIDFKENFTGFENHLVGDDCFLTEVYPRSIQTA